MTKKENIISILKTNPEVFPYLNDINNDSELVKELYRKKIDLTKYLNESLKKIKLLFLWQ